MSPPKMPVASGRKLAEFFQTQGFKEDRRHGSHIIMEKAGIDRPLVIPNYRELSADIILNNLRTAGISRKDFIAALQKRKK